jgi:S-phase kinase-associated protein 1
MAEEKSQASSSSKTITLKAFDGVLFDVDLNIAKEMKTVQACIDDAEDIETVPVPNVSGKHLAIVIEYIKKRTHNEEYDDEFVKNSGDNDLKELLLAANYLNISSLLNCTCQAIAKRIENKSVEFVRKYFNVENDYSPEEEAKLREETPWAHEGVDKD